MLFVAAILKVANNDVSRWDIDNFSKIINYFLNPSTEFFDESDASTGCFFSLDNSETDLYTVTITRNQTDMKNYSANKS